jgi:hypothetical protein
MTDARIAHDMSPEDAHLRSAAHGVHDKPFVFRAQRPEPVRTQRATVVHPPPACAARHHLRTTRTRWVAPSSRSGRTMARTGLRERPRLSTPGVLGSGPSYVVSVHLGLLRPHRQSRRHAVTSRPCRQQRGLPKHGMRMTARGVAATARSPVGGAVAAHLLRARDETCEQHALPFGPSSGTFFGPRIEGQIGNPSVLVAHGGARAVV